MKNDKGSLRIWSLVLLVVAFVAGCGTDHFGPAKMTSFSLDGVSGKINEPAKTVTVTMPSGTDYLSGCDFRHHRDQRQGRDNDADGSCYRE